MNDNRVASSLRRSFAAIGMLAAMAACSADSSGPDVGTAAPVVVNRLNVGEATTCAISSANHVFCWGLNSGFAEYGVSPVRRPSSSTPVATDTTTFVALSNGHGSHACGIASTGNAKCWGRNTSAQLGTSAPLTGDTVARSVLAPRFSTISVGRLTSCGISDISVAYCWGANQLGEGGNSTRALGENASTPRKVETNDEFTSLAAGWAHSCGIVRSGQLYCWGDNKYGQPGIGTVDTVARRIPVAVQTSLRFKQVSAGGTYTCAISTDNSAYCWGQNSTGNLGDGTTTLRSAPVAIGGTLKFSKISTSTGFATGSVTGTPTAAVGSVAHTCALTETGTAYCWGYNAVGQVGDGSTTDRLAPVAVSGGQTFTEIGAGGLHSCGMRGNVVACWGGNASGQLGNGNFNNSSVPVIAGAPFAN